MTKDQIQTHILENLEKQGYQVDLAETKEVNNFIIVEDLRKFLKNYSNFPAELEKSIPIITGNSFELFHNCHLLRWIKTFSINFQPLENNIFRAIGYQKEIGNTLDLIIYINGIPVITWKIGDEDDNIERIYEQLNTECHKFQQIYSFNVFSLISKGLTETRYGIPWVKNELDEDWGWEWRDLEGRDICFKGSSIAYVIENLLNKKDLLTIIKYFICAFNDDYRKKKICWYQQFYLASKFAREINSCIESGKQQAGIQRVVPRSGRAHILLFLCKLLISKKMPIVIFLDRVDVRYKLLKTFKGYKKFLNVSEICEMNSIDFYSRYYNYEQILFSDINVLRGVNEVICLDEVICIFYEVGSRKYTTGIRNKKDRSGKEISVIPRMDRLRMYLPNAIFLEIASYTKQNSTDIFGKVHGDEYQLDDLVKDGIAMKWDYEDRSQIRSISGSQSDIFTGGARCK